MKWVIKVAFGLCFVIAGLNHFRSPDFYVRMMPPYLPLHRELVYLSGVAEVILGSLLLIPATSVPAAWGLIALLVAVFPANVQMALHPETFPAMAPTVLWLRLPLQAVLIALAYWFTRPNTALVLDASRRSAMLLGLIVISGGNSPAWAGVQPIGIEVSSRSLQPGELVVVTLSVAAAATDVRVTVFGKGLAAFHDRDDQWRALVGIDLDQAPGRYELVATARLESSDIRTSQLLVVTSKTFTTRTLRVAPDFVKPSASVRERIARDSQRVSEAYGQSAAERLWRAPFGRPVGHPANSRFGQHSVFNGLPRGRHTGTDFLSPAGTVIKAPNGGRVVLADDLFMSAKPSSSTTACKCFRCWRTCRRSRSSKAIW